MNNIAKPGIRSLRTNSQNLEIKIAPNVQNSGKLVDSYLRLYKDNYININFVIFFRSKVGLCFTFTLKSWKCDSQSNNLFFKIVYNITC
ncbi:hypothetical protein BpHYR1_001904 [Brachionus plicatilis]|uniref:Uncharacterized protein n=1 Tax=Brachionus plicatilis TaxID=10195 RepID=A0A3M7SIU1_BRAPC|nr:hypothetical protein BpHYR1_001904 [Brachionus plicatilis]